MAQMDQVVQRNAASAEESSSASEELTARRSTCTLWRKYFQTGQRQRAPEDRVDANQPARIPFTPSPACRTFHSAARQTKNNSHAARAQAAGKGFKEF
jgi:hypothetical protein